MFVFCSVHIFTIASFLRRQESLRYLEIEVPAYAGMAHFSGVQVFVFCFKSPALSQSTINN